MEEDESITSRVKEFIFRNLLFVGLLLFGAILCLVGGYQYLGARSSASEVKFITNQPEPTNTTSITVDVEGEVNNPGVYKLEGEPRVSEAIAIAGGFGKNADQEYISKNVNQAQKIADGAKIYIPAVGEIDSSQKVLGTTNTDKTVVVQSTSSQNNGLININNASLEELDTLPKVGPVTAQKIVDGRPYGSIEELVSKKVLTQKTFDGLKDKIIAQ